MSAVNAPPFDPPAAAAQVAYGAGEHYGSAAFLRAAEQRYRQLLGLMRAAPSEFLVPTYDMARS